MSGYWSNACAASAVLLGCLTAADSPSQPADAIAKLTTEVERLKRVDEAHQRCIRMLAREVDRRGVVILQAQNSTIYVEGAEVVATPDQPPNASHRIDQNARSAQRVTIEPSD